MQSTSRPATDKAFPRYPFHGMRSTQQWSYCSLACDGVTGGPATSRRFRNLMPSLRARRAAERGYRAYTTIL